MEKYYQILGITEYATDRELSEAYFGLRKKYQEERFLEGEKGNEAAKKLTEIDNAYDEIVKYRREHSSGEAISMFKEVDEAIKGGDLKKAQDLLDSFDERNGEWHYLQAVVFYKKGWMNESKKQLEIALNLEADNAKYKTAYDKLVKKMTGPGPGADWNRSGTTGGGNQGAPSSGGYTGGEPQMGGESCGEFCCRVAICNMCLNCLCNCR